MLSYFREEQVKKTSYFRQNLFFTTFLGLQNSKTPNFGNTYPAQNFAAGYFSSTFQTHFFLPSLFLLPVLFILFFFSVFQLLLLLLLLLLVHRAVEPRQAGIIAQNISEKDIFFEIFNYLKAAQLKFNYLSFKKIKYNF